MIIGKDINGLDVAIGQRVKRGDGVVGSFSLEDFQLRFEYEYVQENGAICSYINNGYADYEII